MKRDKELSEYRKKIGSVEYKKQYSALYQQTRQQKGRYSKLEYENSPERLNQIREKYKNGVTKEILDELLR